jgi:hypothetical protein
MKSNGAPATADSFYKNKRNPIHLQGNVIAGLQDSGWSLT